jgi:cytidyltransferase-like protein
MTKPKRIAYSFLIADLIHYGHLSMLETARKNADYHICGVISDAVVEKWISPKICTYEERKGVIESIRYVDEVICQDSMDPTENLKEIHKKYPDATIVLVRNHHLWESTLGGSYIQQINGEIVSHDFYPGLSRENISRAFFNSFVEKQNLSGAVFNDVKLGDIKYFQENFSTKANTLRRLKSFLKHAVIEQEFIFTVDQWKREESGVIAAIMSLFGQGKLVIRSSSLNEDSLMYSNAGYYKSVLHVKPSPSDIRNAVEEVIKSYLVKGEGCGQDQVLVQRQTQNVVLSGVIFTRNISTNTPYYLINFDDDTANTDSVTGGVAGNKIEILRETRIEDIPAKWRGVLRAVREVEEYFKGVALDIEFAVKGDGTVVIFQVRPLAANSKFFSIDDDLVLDRVKSYVGKYQKLDNIAVLGRLPYLSDMAFWNPAELIGDRPNNLDCSLFSHLIMKSCWNAALRPLGYSKVDGSLQVLIGNKPYIDVPRSFLSLLPEGQPAVLKRKLLGFYSTKLRHRPELHDKIEFEIVHNCYRFDFHKSADELLENGFTKNEVRVLAGSLIHLTNNILSNFKKAIKEDNGCILTLESAYRAIERKKARGTLTENLDIIHELVENCMEYGIMPFVRAARFAFIGNAMLRSLLDIGVISREEFDGFLGSIHTVASGLDDDFNKLKSGRVSTKTFLRKYGHLRPGTYDITNMPYRKNPAYISIGRVTGNKAVKEARRKGISANDLDGMAGKISIECKKTGIKTDGRRLLDFIRTATELREYYKFVYTRNISLALEILAEAGEKIGFSREELANLDYYSVVNYRKTCSDDEIAGIWRNLIKSAKEEKRVNQMVSLPPVIFSDKDFVTVPSYSASPNFVTDSTVDGELVFLDGRAGDVDITDKAVVIEKADPGYDWIFTKRIKALLTKYGGAASHMTIRCSEFGIPAAIGCGDLLFSRITKSSRVILDCRKKTVSLL